MEQFVLRKNLERLRKLLESVTDDQFRDQIKQLIADLEEKESASNTACPATKGERPVHVGRVASLQAIKLPDHALFGDRRRAR
jgi:hypothetical protein